MLKVVHNGGGSSSSCRGCEGGGDSGDAINDISRVLQQYNRTADKNVVCIGWWPGMNKDSDGNDYTGLGLNGRSYFQSLPNSCRVPMALSRSCFVSQWLYGWTNYHYSCWCHACCSHRRHCCCCCCYHPAASTAMQMPLLYAVADKFALD